MSLPTNRPGIRWRLARLVAGCVVVAGPLAAAPALAQQPESSGTVTLAGSVVDEVTGAPVSGAFLSLGPGGPRTIADSAGAFRMAGVPTGRQRLRVERFGYAALELEVTVRSPPEPLRLRLAPDPVVLEGIEVAGAARVALSGAVVDAVSGERLPWASLWLSADAVRGIARAASDGGGVFRLPAVPTGAYFLRVQLPGYESQYVAVLAAAAPSSPGYTSTSCPCWGGAPWTCWPATVPTSST